MATLNIDFEWDRDEAGYEFVPPCSGDRRSCSHVADEAEDAATDLLRRIDNAGRIVRKGGNLVPYRPLEKVPGLHKIFAHTARSPEGLFNFVTRFGPLTAEGRDPNLGRGGGDSVAVCISHAETMHAFLEMDDVEKKSYISSFGKFGPDWFSVAASLSVSPETGLFQILLRPKNLLAALWFELAQLLSGDATIRQCLHCGSWFEVGPGTGRRLDAKFCKDEHRVIFNSRKRGGGSKDA